MEYTIEKNEEDQPLSKTTISCDACLRSNLPCIGFPCERCNLYDLECLYSPPEARISELRQQFESLLPKDYIASTTSDVLSHRSRNPSQSEEKMGCVVCSYLQQPCGGQKPKCAECEREEYLCLYDKSCSKAVDISPCLGCVENDEECAMGPRGQGCQNCNLRDRLCDLKDVSLSKRGERCLNCAANDTECDGSAAGCHEFIVASKSMSQDSGKTEELRKDLKDTHLNFEADACDTCKVWTSPCDSERPSCSSCSIRGVTCTYTTQPARPPKPSSSSRFSTSASSLISSRNTHQRKYPTPSERHRAPRRIPSPPTQSRYYHPIPTSNPSPALYATLFSPPISQMYSTPSGCISCFDSKSKCISSSSPRSSSTFNTSDRRSRKCQRCRDLGIHDCRPFPPGTRLIACDACMDSGRACTNLKEGLRCDACVEQGGECSRVEKGKMREVATATATATATARSGNVHQAGVVMISENGEESEQTSREVEVKGKDNEDENETNRRTCRLCEALDQFCDGVEPTCALCSEVGEGCVYLIDAPPRPATPHLSATNPAMTNADAENSSSPSSVDLGRERGTAAMEGTIAGKDEDKRLEKEDEDWEEISRDEVSTGVDNVVVVIVDVERRDEEFGVMELD